VKVTRLCVPALVAAVAVLVGCKGPAGPALSGTMQGFVYLHDEFGAPLASDSGITVTALPTASTSTSNPDGRYSFTSLSTGVYSLQFIAPGFGSYVLANQQFLGGGTIDIPGINLGKVSTGVITGFTLTPNASGDTIFATGTISPAPPVGIARYVRIFYSSQANVASNVTLWTVTGPVSGPPYAVTDTTFTIPVTGLDLRALQHEFASGSTVNAIAYGESYYENSYPDEATGRTVFPNVSAKPSSATTFTMPNF
jgi:Carboxypeptidase regulatory-like domain